MRNRSTPNVVRLFSRSTFNPIPAFEVNGKQVRGIAFDDYMMTTLNREGNLANLDDRRRWIERHMLPHYRRFYEADFNGLVETVDRIVKRLRR
jgi:hypothetical protein